MTHPLRRGLPTRPVAGRRLRLLAAAVFFAVTASACTDSAPERTQGPADAPPPAADTAPEAAGPSEGGSDDEDGDEDRVERDRPVVVDAAFEPGPCGFAVPPGTEPRCGTVAVPMDWQTGEGRVELAVAVFPARSPDPAPDPIVYLEGGPGGHVLDAVRLTHAQLVAPLQDRRDVILFDQRGVGRSTPALGCPEITAATREAEDGGPEVGAAEAERAFLDALVACRARLEADGVDLATFTTIDNAHDVEAIRVALGYESWNLFGISYGTRLGLEVLRQHPDGVRSAVLDSVFPPDADSVAENPGSFLASYEAVVAACAAEASCEAAGPLDERLRAVVERYEADPVRVEVTDLLTGTTDEIDLRGDTIVGIVLQALYSPEWFGDLPELAADLEAGRLWAAETYLSRMRSTESLFSPGMFYAVVCNDEVAFADEDAVAAALPPDPFGLQDEFDYGSNVGAQAFLTCDAFGSNPSPAVADEPVTSDVPTLVLAGRYDPVTPVVWAERAVRTLPGSHLVIDEFGSHGVSIGPCPMDIVNTFVDEPSIRPDTSCLDGGAVRFLAPVDGSVVLETVERATASGRVLVTARPQEWLHGELPGDSYRQSSLLDPTQLIQVADDPLTALGLELYLDQTYDVQLGPGTDRPPDGRGRVWRERTGRSEVAEVVWSEATIGDSEVVVILVSAPGELDANLASVGLPALEAIEVR